MVVRNISDATIEQVLMLGKSAIIDFWAPWCQPCRHLGPIIEAIAEANPDIEVCKINIEENPKAVLTHKVHSIPVVLFFKDGEIVHRLVGLQSQETLQGIIDKEL